MAEAWLLFGPKKEITIKIILGKISSIKRKCATFSIQVQKFSYIRELIEFRNGNDNGDGNIPVLYFSFSLNPLKS